MKIKSGPREGWEIVNLRKFKKRFIENFKLKQSSNPEGFVLCDLFDDQVYSKSGIFKGYLKDYLPQ